MPDAAVIGTSLARQAVYLHGFASSSSSTKARYFADRFRAAGVAMQCPDFNEPDFRSLTITRMLGQLRVVCDAVKGSRVTLIGSSLGGTLAILAAERFADIVDRVVLFAPAVKFMKPGHHLTTPDRIAEWRRAGALPFFHYAYNEERLLDYAFYEDAARYDPFAARFDQPTLIFQGTHDESVDCRTVEDFARVRPNVTLSLLDDDHQLVASLPVMWEGMRRFLELGP